jgi:hypothetical protein
MKIVHNLNLNFQFQYTINYYKILQIISKCIALMAQICENSVEKQCIIVAHRSMESSLVSIYKKQYDKFSILLQFSTMSLGDWRLKFQEGYLSHFSVSKYQ